MRRVVFLPVLGLVAAPAAAAGQTTVHPIYAHVPGAPENPVAEREFKDAAARYKLGPVQTVDVPVPPAPRTGDRIRAGIEALGKGPRFDDALRELDAAAGEVAKTGGDGIEPVELGSLYLHRGWARQRATWNTATGTPTPPDALADYVRAHLAFPEMHITPRNFPPAVVEGWNRAVADVARRPRGTLTVHAPGGQVILNGHSPVAAPAVFSGLPYAEYVVRIERPGRPDWGEVVPVAAPGLVIEPEAPPLFTLDDAIAAAEARRMGTKFALVGEPRVGGDRLLLDLRLVDATTGQRRDATTVTLAGERGAVDSAVMRLDEEARGVDLARERGREATPAPAPLPGAPPPGPAAPPPAPLPAPVDFDRDPVGWGRRHWPLVTACAVFAGSALIMTLMVASDNGRGP